MSENNATPFEANTNATNPQGSPSPAMDAWGNAAAPSGAGAQSPYAQPAGTDSAGQAAYQGNAGGALPTYPSAAAPYGANSANATYGYGDPAATYGAPAYGTAAYGEPPINQPWYGIDFVNAIKRFFLKYATFSGRASRGEFWWAYLALILLGIVTGFLELLPVIGQVLSVLIGLAILVPQIAISVRRLHDTNLSGWLLLLPFGLGIASGIIIIASFAPMLAIIADNIDNLDALDEEAMTEAALPALAGGGIGFLLGLIGFILFIVLMARKSNPAGARFDK